MINIELLKFQEEAVTFMLENTGKHSHNKEIVLHAPTGSGKTIVAVDFIDKYLEATSENTVIVWLSTGQGDLEDQSKKKFEDITFNRNAKDIFEVFQSGFEVGDTVFINWESVTKTGNVAIKDGDYSNIYDRIIQAHRMGISFILIIDEEHVNNTPKASNFMSKFDAVNVIRLSATPDKNNGATWFEIDERDVIESGLITQNMYLNDGIDDSKANIDSEYEYLIDMAEEKRDLIASQYEKINKDINPLVIIQMPNNDDELVSKVEAYIEDELGYTYENGLSKWFAEDDNKRNLENITQNDSKQRFLLVKQAIATGWDCRRAKILVKLRKRTGERFTIQTLGRIRRMPEAKHYENDILDSCFVYTFDEEFKYEVFNQGGVEKVTLFLKEKAKSLTLTKEVRNHATDNRNVRDVIKSINSYFIEEYNLGQKKVRKDNFIKKGFIFDTKINRTFYQGKIQTLSELKKQEIVKQTKREVDTHKDGRILQHAVGKISNSLSLSYPTTNELLRRLFHYRHRGDKINLLSLNKNQWWAFVINNYDLLIASFDDLVNNIYENVELNLGMIKERTFKIPEVEEYKFDPISNKVGIYENNAYKNYSRKIVVEKTRSSTEIIFEEYCENNDNVDWYYKNGDKGEKYFSIVYYDSLRGEHSFYADYIIKLKSGEVWIIETKGGERGNRSNDIDKKTKIKFLAFKKYVEERHPELKWGFVRDKDGALFLNNTIYTDVMAGKNWEDITTVF